MLLCSQMLWSETLPERKGEGECPDSRLRAW